MTLPAKTEEMNKKKICCLGNEGNRFLFVLVSWLVDRVLWHINLCKLFNAKSMFIQIISSISNNSVEHE